MPGQPVVLPRSIRALQGQVVASRYLVEEVIGVGGMAIVFRGTHLHLQRPVAIKVLRPDFGDNREIVARFDREARAVSGFDHPNLRQVFDCGFTQNGLKFMAMQWLEGRELGSLIGHSIPPSQCAAMMTQIFRGLDHAHRHGIVHRDLKPDNIFVTRDANGRDVLKVVDFGIAKITDEKLADGLTTSVGAIVGTPAYMSPEQALGIDADGRADLYSAGVVLYELLTGTPPFASQGNRELMRAHVAGRIPELPSSVPAALGDGLNRLLAREREARFPDAASAIAAFEQIEHTLRTDRTPWLDLFDVDAGPRGTHAVDTQAQKLRAVDDALKKVLAQHTPIAEKSLRAGIVPTPLIDAAFDEEG